MYMCSYVHTYKGYWNHCCLYLLHELYFKGSVTDTGGEKIKLCFVTKQILIHQLPQALIVHFKRFNIGTIMVTKEPKHVTFSPILNMAPYCSNKCLEAS